MDFSEESICVTKYVKRGLIICMLALVCIVLAYLLGVKTYGAFQKGA